MFRVVQYPLNFSQNFLSHCSCDASARNCIVSYLVDFLVISQTRAACLPAQQTLVELLVGLGFSIKWEKVVKSSRRIQSLGLIIASKNNG